MYGCQKKKKKKSVNGYYYAGDVPKKIDNSTDMLYIDR